LVEIAERGQALKAKLLAAVDDDTRAFDGLLAAMRLPKGTPEEQAVRAAAIEAATVTAIEVPLSVLELCPEIIELCREVARIGLQASRSDGGTGAQVARAAAAGAYQNLCVNLSGLVDKARGAALLARGDAAWQRTQELHRLAEQEILASLREAAHPPCR
ncbi:MAG: cyclodeaminase/cyclohydrolase family protein, partial [Holophagae bacterium]|nr:cyclodeaminase/cyclohydrolase family protein [Holophagae bacterium]